MPSLFIIATPIGNLEDITFRALHTLREADVILCEDTRVASKLLSKYEIQKPLLSYHSQSGIAKIGKIFTLLEEGKNLALVTDAGTPGISDPGSLLVSRIREHFKEGVSIVPVPGPSAVIAALSESGLPSSEFLFLGFLPHKKGRETAFREIAASRRTVVFYESPHRILKTLDSLQEHVSEKRIVLAREITKLHEELISGSPQEVKVFFEAHPEKVRGEFVVMVGNII